MYQRPLNIMLVAGEASGDAHAARLVRALNEAMPANVTYFGAAGPKMREAGVDAVVRSDELSVVGLIEIGTALPMFLRAFRSLKEAAQKRNPDVAILVDFPDFNLRLARKLKKKGIRVVYYISPQLWAWRSYRVNIIRRYVDLMLTILPFEKDWYQRHGVEHVEYVGNPLVREVKSTVDRNAFRAANGIGADDRMIALLPGSRRKEIERIMPEMVAAARLMKDPQSDLVFVVASGGKRNSEQIRTLLDELDPKRELGIKLIQEETYDVLNAADAAAITSGTATLEAGILNVPMAVVYKSSSTNYRILRPLINAEHFALVNLLAGKRIVTELIQHELSPQTLADELVRILDPTVNRQMRQDLNDASSRLGEGGASRRAAAAIIGLLNDQ